MRHERKIEAVRLAKDSKIQLRRCLILVASFAFLVSLSDVPSVNASYLFDHAERRFIQGHLKDAQREAEDGHRRFLYSNPSWARRFQLLEATSLAWRGLNEDVLKALADERVPWSDPEDNIQRFALEGTALSYLHRFREADRKLASGDRLCGAKPSKSCGAVLRSHGLVSFERGEMLQAKEFFALSLAAAKSSRDGMLEATALLNLGHVASQQEHHDEALAFLGLASQKASEMGAKDLQQDILGNEAWEQYALGNLEKALSMWQEATDRAASLGDTGDEIAWITATATIYADEGRLAQAEESDIRVRDLARSFDNKQQIINASEDLAQVFIDEGKPREAEGSAVEALVLSQITGNKLDILYCHMLQGEAAALQQQWSRAESLLHEVAIAPESQNKMRWTAQHTLATMYEAQGQMSAAEQSYRAAIGLVEVARADLKQEVSRLTFLANAASIYDDYIHFLVAQGRQDEALEAADWSRARTLQQGLGVVSTDASLKPAPLRANAIARKMDATLLFYWMGDKQSFVWAISPEKTTLATLPAKNEIISRMQRYRRALLALKDPLREHDRQGDKDGRELYEMLVTPVSGALSKDRSVVLFTDGEMSQLNFETLIAGGPTPHYWIEDATVSSAPSIRLLAGKGAAANIAHEKLLLLGDSLSSDPSLPRLPMAGLEVQKVQAKFALADQMILSGAKATPAAYLASKPEQFAYIHFVAHGAANNTDPLESAVVLSKDGAGEDSYKLFARDILQHPISARLVTISACNSSGTKSYVGEGMVGLSWAFLRAGAHNTIGALWDVSDASTPELMDRMYSRLQRNVAPAAALREAKLALLHSQGGFNRPFYWAPFQLYSGR